MAAARATGVLALGVLALHELSYLIAGGSPSAAHGGHAYLTQAIPVVVVLATALLAAALLAPLGGGPLARESRGVVSRTLLYASALLGALWAQELTEVVLAPVPLDALTRLLPGGLVALPLALALGAVAALTTRWLEDVEERLAAAQGGSSPARMRVRAKTRRPAAAAHRAPAAGASLAFGFARRPPPEPLPV
jgi:hypothetical protein